MQNNFSFADEETKVLSSLKKFQLATAERIFDLFTNNQNRVLVADEVGLGKTIVAKAVIAKLARIHIEQNKLFKVVYVCSNQTIASQNLSKLKISENCTLDGITDTRLSMQHLKIFEQQNSEQVKKSHLQLIPITPSTSFFITTGGGMVGERALIFSIIRRMPPFCNLTAEEISRLRKIFECEASMSWEGSLKRMEERIQCCNRLSNGAYLDKVIELAQERFKESNLNEKILSLLDSDSEKHKIIGEIRKEFAKVSIELLEPDLVIMDEFQRFRTILDKDENNETNVLANKFLGKNNLKVLLLSATPYKLYSTLDEIYENNNIDDHYREFFKVIEFLFDPTVEKQFKEIWHNYSLSLREYATGNTAILEIKRNAENLLYKGICRTERLSVFSPSKHSKPEEDNYPLQISENDIKSFIEAEKLINSIQGNLNIPTDYVKSTPYLLSFAQKYKLRTHLDKHFKDNPQKIATANKKLLWINDKAIRKYKKLDAVNARLEALQKIVFDNGVEYLLWVPPSKPYYDLKGNFSQARNFSKILLFSAWEMVPKMISTLLSYEAERLTIGSSKTHKEGYFSKKRYPSRLKFRIEDDEPRSMNLFCLLYPSLTLAKIYNPIEQMNSGKCIEDIEDTIKHLIEAKLSCFSPKSTREDDRWYFLAPLFWDGDFAGKFLNNPQENSNEEGISEDKLEKSNYEKHLKKLLSYYNEKDTLELGSFPSDLAQVLTKMAIASPAVCALRSLGEEFISESSRIAKAMLDMFNLPEATAIIDITTKPENDTVYWKNVLEYCRDGCIQSVFDEHLHLIKEANGLNYSGWQKEGAKIIVSSMKIHTSNFVIDTYQSYKKKIQKNKERGLSLRTHFAVAFYQTKGEESKMFLRRDSIRNSFNSPYRPFVLSSTSIGQEGLDFHFYCRKIVHWNLPANPVDIEQREGRIDRFKCLAIRQSIAHKFFQHTFSSNDVWEELFLCAKKEYDSSDSELVPFWCLPDSNAVNIEKFILSYPYSKDIGKFERIQKILSLYRITMGQRRQEELLEYLFNNCDDSTDFSNLLINLSPYFRKVNNSETSDKA